MSIKLLESPECWLTLWDPKDFSHLVILTAWNLFQVKQNLSIQYHSRVLSVSPATRSCSLYHQVRKDQDLECSVLTYQCQTGQFIYFLNNHVISLPSWKPKFEFRCTHPRRNWDHNKPNECTRTVATFLKFAPSAEHILCFYWKINRKMIICTFLVTVWHIQSERAKV